MILNVAPTRSTLNANGEREMILWNFEVRFLTCSFLAISCAIPAMFLEPSWGSQRTTAYGMCTWSQPEEADAKLRPALIAKLDCQRTGEAKLGIYERERLVFSYSPGLFPIGIQVLQDGNLASLWSHANGKIHLYVFTRIKGKVKLALDADSKMMPEFIYQSKGVVISDSTSPKVPFYIQRIVVAHTDWIKPPGSKDGELSNFQPLFVDIFSWDPHKRMYNVKNRVPWNSRFEAL